MSWKQITGMAMLAAALMFGVADMLLSAAPTYGSQEITMGRLWAMISLRSMDLVETLITHHLWGPIWSRGISPILYAPAWSVFLVLGFLFFVFGRAKVSRR